MTPRNRRRPVPDPLNRPYGLRLAEARADQLIAVMQAAGVRERPGSEQRDADDD
jgi:hypothetical protein